MKIAILTSNTGVEKVELESPADAARTRGWDVEHLALDAGDVQTVNHDIEKDVVHQAAKAVADTSVDDYDGLIIPGGTINADTLRADHGAVAFITRFVEAKKPVASICHGPWGLVEAGVLPGKTLTSYPSLRTDVTNAGGTWVDQEVVHCPANGWNLVTSRNPGDLDAFNAKIAEVFDS
ncbi:type 1 glutamine amidotransferase domain-containing protein [Aeromicrobium sp. UC242_57]|uniref:type 1 glutamine amidotransferase domain-containing protein n=1 Tax=Aeromicrobium sp. UC242_57 TaxID=3374624 RepID=UPI0037B5D526